MKTSDSVTDSPLSEVRLKLERLNKNVSLLNKRLRDCFIESLEDTKLVLDPFLVKAFIASIESDPNVCQYLTSQTILSLKDFTTSECEKVTNLFEARLRQFCEKNQISLEGRFPTYFLAGFLNVTAEQTKGECRIGEKSVKSLMLDSISPVILDAVKQETGRPFEAGQFLKNLFEAYDRVTRLSRIITGQPVPILDVFREFVFTIQSASFEKNPTRSNFTDYTKDNFARDLSRASKTNTTVNGKRMELAPTAFPHEMGLFIRTGESSRYVGRLAFTEANV